MLFRSAPRLAVYAPRALIAGSDAVVEVELTTERPTHLHYVDVEIVGRQGWRVSSQTELANDLVGPRLGVRVMGAGVLPHGRTRLPIKFHLPDMPPSHYIGPAYADLQLAVHVAMPWWQERPWWPDTRRAFTLVVRTRAPARVVREPLAWRTETATATAPRLEVALASSRLIAGERVPGKCALFHVDDHKPRSIKLAFLPMLRLHGGRHHRNHTGVGFVVTVAVPAGSAGKTVPFSFRLPADTTPSFRSATHDLEWRLLATADLGLLGGKLELAVPVEIVDAAAAPTAPRLVRAPRLTDQRVAALFADFAQRAAGWRAIDSVGGADDDDGDTDADGVERRTEDGQLRLAYVYRGKAGTFLRATIDTASLGLGVRFATTRHNFARPPAGRGIRDRIRDVGVRFAEQARPVVAAVLDAMASATELGTLVVWTDEVVIYEAAIKSLDAPAIAAAAAALARVDDAIRAARAHIAPPPGIAIDVAAWRALAARLHGRLSVGDLSLIGTIDAHQAEVALERSSDDTPVAIVGTVRGGDHIGDAGRAFHLDAEQPGRHGRAWIAVLQDAGDPTEAAVARVLATWPDDIIHLELADGIARGRIALPAAPAGAGDGVSVPADTARELVERLAAVVAALGSTAGPYR